MVSNYIKIMIFILFIMVVSGCEDNSNKQVIVIEKAPCVEYSMLDK